MSAPHSSAVPRPPFRFDALNHEYIDLATGETRPHITGMLDAAGLVDDLWFTEESSERGNVVHKLTADYDLGAITNPASVISKHKGYLLGHVKAMEMLRPEFLAVEEPFMHPTHKFGGRPDRDARVYFRRSVIEIKAAIPQKSHAIQTALQAILIAPFAGLPPETIGRYCLYLKPDGKFRLEEHVNMRDFAEAKRIIRMCCGEAK